MLPRSMKQQRWLRIIPVALIMYTISYVDRTNVSLALDPTISTMMRDLLMDDRMKGHAAGIFFLGYFLLQIPCGQLTSQWSAKKLITILLVLWGVCAVGCGLTKSFRQFETMRFFLGLAESGVFPATTVLLASWFPRSERARANSLWNLCQPLAVAASAPITGALLGIYGWKTMIVLEGALPFLWLPIWWFFMSDHPRDADWISAGEKEFLENILKREAAEIESTETNSTFRELSKAQVIVMVIINFLHNSAAYGCMAFLTEGLKGKGFGASQYGILFAVPYAVTAVIMSINSWHSDKTHERRGHVAIVYTISGLSLLASVMLRNHFWMSYAFMCLAIPGPFAALAPFWAIPTESLPRNAMGWVIGLVNGVGNLGGYVGPLIVGHLKYAYGSTALPFNLLAIGLILASMLAMLLPKTRRPFPPAELPMLQVGAQTAPKP